MVYNKTQTDRSILSNEKNTIGKCIYRNHNQLLIPIKKLKPLH